MISAFISRLVILVFGTLYPAYASYKAVKTKNVKEYVKWMMYWIVFALFTCAETVTDVLFNWLPFYYEIKIVWVVWLLSPATKGSSILYRKFVHPTLSNREQEIDEYINRAKEHSYKQFLDLGSKGVSVIMQTAIKGGGGIVNQLKKSYSLSDLSNPDQVDGMVEMRMLRKRDDILYYSQMDLNEALEVDSPVEDIGYSSSDGLPPKLHAREGLSRAASLTRNTRTSTTRVTRSKKTVPSDEVDIAQTKGVSTLLDQESSEEDFLECLDVVHESKITACRNVDQRGGKYNKKIAPKPPDEQSAIKATLVLKPGIVRSTSQQKEIFINSPKTKRRRNIDQSLSKLLNIPKKIHLWKKSDNKRSSWHEVHHRSDSLKVNQLIFKSKSDNNIAIDKKVDGINEARSRVSVQSLTESPMAKRRLKIIRRYVDEDID